LNHGTNKKPLTSEGKLVQIFDKAIVMEPEVMMHVLMNIIKEQQSWDNSYSLFLKKMNKWYERIPNDSVRAQHSLTIKYLNVVNKND